MGTVETATARTGSGGNAWERSPWAWHLLLPVPLAVAIVATLADPSTGASRRAVAVAGSIAMVGWYWLLRPDLERSSEGVRRGVIWGLGSVLGWMVLVLAHPAFFLVLFGLFPTIFATLEFRPATALAALLGLEIVIANLQAGDPTVAELFGAMAMTAVSIGLSIVLALWIHGIIDQSRDRRALIDEIEATRTELAAAERAAGIAQERGRLAAEIHDTLAQGFTSIILVLQSVEAALDDREPSRRQIDLAIEAARNGLDDARRLIADAGPAPLDEANLPDALRRVGDRFAEECSVAVDVAVAGTYRHLEPLIEVALLRAAQESLANIRKHARAGSVRVVLHYGVEVTLRVVDDGLGFDPAVPSNGFGLRAMAARLETVDGRVSVRSEPGSGTQVAVTVP